MRTRIKICGITRPADAEFAAECGADAIGMICYEHSARYVSLTQAQQIISSAGAFVTTVAVVVNPDAALIRMLENKTRVDRIQFHGDETQTDCELTRLPWYKALRVAPVSDLAAMAKAFPHASALMLDTWVEGARGGTGETFDWSLLQDASITQPIILAGGLTPDNVYDAVLTVRPYAVDVGSGVEASPGIKDAGKVNEFIIAVREADQEILIRRHSL